MPELTPIQLQLLFSVADSNKAGKPRIVAESEDLIRDALFMSELGLIALEQLYNGLRLHVTLQGSKVARRLSTPAVPRASGFHPAS